MRSPAAPDPRRGETRIMDRPVPGYWLIRLARGAPLVPACIRLIHTTSEPGNPDNAMERSPFLAAFVSDEPVDMDRVWLTRGEPIPKIEYLYKCADAAWAKEHAQDEPAANPRKPVDLLQSPLPF